MHLHIIYIYITCDYIVRQTKKLSFYFKIQVMYIMHPVKISEANVLFESYVHRFFYLKLLLLLLFLFFCNNVAIIIGVVLILSLSFLLL